MRDTARLLSKSTAHIALGCAIAFAPVTVATVAGQLPAAGAAPAAAPAPQRTMGRTSFSNLGSAGFCTWGAYQKWFEASGNRYYPDLVGNAKDVPNDARAKGWTVVAQPQPRSIVVFQPGVQGAFVHGHMAWVDGVQDRLDGRYLSITEMNYNGGLNQWHSRMVKHVPGMEYILMP